MQRQIKLVFTLEDCGDILIAMEAKKGNGDAISEKELKALKEDEVDVAIPMIFMDMSKSIVAEMRKAMEKEDAQSKG